MHYLFFSQQLVVKIYVPAVLNVHVNEKKSTFLEGVFSSSKQLTFEKENVILF